MKIPIVANFILLILLLTFPDFIDAYRQIRTQKQWFRYPGNPGIKIRLTKKGSNYIKSVGVGLFNDYVSNLKDYSTSIQYSQIGFNGVVSLNKLHVKNYHAPQLSVLNFLPPRHIVLGLENIDMSLGSHFEANSPPFKYEGSLDGSLSGMTIVLTTELLTDVSGRMNALVRNCSALINRSHITLNPTGPMGIFVKTFETMINESVRQKIPEFLCGRLQTMIEKNMPKIFDQLIQIDLKDYFPSINPGDKDFMSLFVSQFARGMFLDNRMITQPTVTMEYIETNHLGEVRFANDLHNAAPFYPRPMEDQIPKQNPDRMAHFYISDHVFNTMLFHAFQDNRLSIKIDKTNLPEEMKGFVSTTCPSRKNPTYVCVGSLIPQIGKSYPNCSTSFIVLPHGLPYVMFNRDATTIEMTNRILTYTEPDDDDINLRKPINKAQILVFSLNGQADIFFSPTDESLNATMTLNRFNVRLHRSAVREINEESIEKLSPLTKTFIAPKLNEAIKKSIKYPMQETIKFKRAAIQNHNGYIVLSTDFEVNDKVLKSIVKKSLNDI